MSLLNKLWKPSYGRFSWKNGRMNRQGYFIWFLISLLAWLLLITALALHANYSLHFSDRSNYVFIILFASLTVFWLWMCFMIAIKRLHDIGYSGWYIPIFIVLYNIIVISFLIIGMMLFGELGTILVGLLSYAGSFAAMLFLFLKKGVVGDNKYGADPLAVK